MGLEKSKGKNPLGEGHNFPRGVVFPAGICFPRGDIENPVGIWTFTAKYFLSA